MDVVHTLPDLLFVSTYSVLILFWAFLSYSAAGLKATGLWRAGAVANVLAR